ncbi:MAG: DUF4982 domain-containing protein, partial [Anaerolineaceae bacterium]|nr:DUF4982 domain-containing protein [Anaerolineaceae bacterium]
GHSLGRKRVVPNYHLEWADVIYAPGQLEARGYTGGEMITGALVETSGPASAIRLLPDRDNIQPIRDDVCVIDVEILDEQGRVVPIADPQVYFTIDGPGKIIGVGNGNPSSHEPEQGKPRSAARRAFNGRCQAIIQPDGQPGDRITFSAHSAGLLGAVVEIHLLESIESG